MSSERSEELRRVTVLFADIVGSTALISGSDPELARARLEPTVRRIRSAISQSGGTIARIAGDGVKALFGAPIVLEEHAMCACLAALRIQAEVAAAGVLEESEGHTPVRIRIGINTGSVLLCSVATDLHVEYAAEGVTTHLAAKAQQSAAPGTTAITAEVARAVEGFFESVPREPLQVDGMNEAIALYRLGKATGARNRFELSLRRGLSALIGRVDELSRLEELASRSRSNGRVSLAALVGEAGVGKSRLLWELRQGLAAQGWIVVSASGTRGGTSIAFHAVLSILRDLYELRPEEDAVGIRSKLESRAGSSLDASPLLVLFDRDPGDPSWSVLDSAQRIRRTQAALAAALKAACVNRPTAILVDGLDESDAETRSFFEALSRRPPPVPMLLLLEGRSAATQTLERLSGIELIPIEPLDSPFSSLLFRNLAGSDPSLRRLESELILRTAGNPFFIEEILRALLDAGVLVGLSGDLRATNNPDVLMPGSVTDIVESRIVRLAQGDRETLEAAAVIGREVPMFMIGGLIDCAPAELSNRLHRLVRAGLLSVDADSGVERFTFRHALTQEVAYRLITRSARLEAHCRLAIMLESPRFEALADRIDLLAHHSLRGHDWGRALGYLQGAAERAADRSAPREVVRLLDEALTVLAQLPAADRSPDREVDIRLSMAFPLVQLGNLERTAREVTQLERLEATCIDRRLQGRLATFVCTQRWLSGEHLRALAIGRRALAIGVEFDDQTILVPARQCLGGALNEIGEYAEALQLLTRNIDTVPEDALGHPFGMAGLPAVFARATRSWIFGHLGRFAEAEFDAAEALRIADLSGHPFSLGSAAFAYGALALARGESSEALPMLEAGVHRCESLRLRMWLPVAGSMLALAHAEMGDIRQAQQVIDRTVSRLDETVIKSSFISLAVVRIYAAIGRRASASRLLEQTLRRVREHGGRTWEAEALLAKGDIAERNVEGDSAARASYERGLSIATELGMACVAARCRLGLAAVARRRGDNAGADALLADAVQALERIGAPAWIRIAGS